MEHKYLDIENGVVKGFKQGSEQSVVEIPDGVTEIGENAFMGDAELTEVIVPSSVTKIGNGAFSWCMSLTTVTILGNIMKLDDWAFAYCLSLQCITIPNSVKTVSKNALSGCRTFKIHYNGTKSQWYSITGIADNRDLLIYAHVHCSDGIVRLELAGCCLLVNGPILMEYLVCNPPKFIQIIPTSITRINPLAFNGCKSRVTITIPNTVTEIGSNAFSGCPNITISYDGTQSDWERIGGNNCGLPKDATVRCTAGEIIQ